MSLTTESRKGLDYTFRRFEPGDERGFLDLFETTWGERRGEDWFRWRFEENPYLDHVPMFVADHDGDVVGVRPYFAFRMRVAGGTELALLTVDTMVHPDHRGRGLFTTMTEQSLEFYADRDVSFVFNQPNGASRPGFESAGFRVLDECRTFHRVQRPSAFLERRLEIPGKEAIARGADRVGTAYRRLPGAGEWETDGVDVERHRGVAATALSQLARRSAFPGITAERDVPFYEWRFASPLWDRATYVANVDGEPVAGILARTRTTEEGVTVTQVADLVPLSGGRTWKRGLAACLEAVLTDAVTADLVSAPGRAFPADVAAAYGFRSDDKLPLSAVAKADAVLCVKSLQHGDTGPWNVNGISLCDPRNWALTFAEQDTT
ncbi:GNAT family N-acetyltransferase [Halobaculum marinum]|uniref:GNAT family N-acetyltransferase n=1 Tax=Halobaculum marinum TaxID=3031996 RepID=A0ABD5WVX7_9EURY|nr:GNAT family N-acetyltransferase [Halobaculum sp. DT55]